MTETENEEQRKARHDKIYSQHPILQVSNLETVFPSHYTFFGKTDVFVRAINSVSFDVYPGETLGIVGESGSGKTTLGRSILQLIRTRSGKIIFNGLEIQSLTQQKLRSVRKRPSNHFPGSLFITQPTVNGWGCHNGGNVTFGSIPGTGRKKTKSH